MKIYIVTCGEYSDYYIDKVFTDREKAEEYRKWRNNANELEEYDTEDDCIVEKYYKICVNYTEHDHGNKDQPTVMIERCNEKYDGYVSFSDFHATCYSDQYTRVSLVRYIPEANWNEEFYTKRYTRAIYDLMSQVKYLLSEGWKEKQIREMLNRSIKD